MGNIKQKPFRQIWTYSRIYWHIQIYPDIFSQTTRHIQILANPDIFKTLVYSEPRQIEYQRYIENLGIFRILASSQPEHRYIYSEFWYIQNARIFRTLECVVKVFNILYKINLNFFNTWVILTTTVFILRKKYGGPWDRGR